MTDVKRNTPEADSLPEEHKKQKLAPSEPETKGQEPQLKLPTDDAFNLWLLMFSTRVESLRTLEGKVYYTERTRNLSQTFQELVKHNFTSCPVLTKTGRKYFNFIEISDIVRYVVNHFKGSEHALANSANFWELIGQQETFNSLTVNDVAKWPLTRNVHSTPIPMGYSLLHVVELMARETDIHRVAIVDSYEKRNLVSVVTQSQLVEFVQQNMRLVGQRKNMLVSEFKHCFHDVVRANIKTMAYDAFEQMAKHGFTGLPIVNDQDQLQDIISIVDIKGMTTDGSLFFRLYHPCSVFLDRIRHDYPSRPSSAVYCKPSDTLETVINMFVKHRIHRLVIVDSDTNKKVVGIVALRDVLKCLLPM